jgi:alpha-tubulin suppressor-like RCC1 family protein
VTFRNERFRRAASAARLKAVAFVVSVAIACSEASGPGTSQQATTIARRAGDAGTGVAGDPLAVLPSVLVTDDAGNGVAGVTVTFSLASGAGSITGAVQQTDVNGVATVGGWILGKTVGQNTLSAAAAGLTNSPITFSALGVAGPPIALAAVGGNTQTGSVGAALPVSPAVRVTDANDNPVAGSKVTFHVSIGQGTLAADTATTNASGVATAGAWTLGAIAGSDSVTASIPNMSATALFTATALPGTPTKLAFLTDPSATVAKQNFTPPVRVAIEDAFGNIVTDRTDGINLAIADNPGAGQLSGNIGINSVAGIATFTTLYIEQAGSGYSLTASSGSLAPATSARFDITPGPAARLAFATQPSTTMAGVDIAPSVRVVVQDAFGNTVTTATNGVSLAFGTNPVGGALSGDIGLNASAGIATFAHLYIEQAGSGYTLVATSPGLTSATSSAFSITAQPATTIAINAGDGQTPFVGAAVATRPSVKVSNAGGAGVAGVDVTFAVVSGGGSITGATATTNSSGIATVGSWTVGTLPGANTITATAANLEGSPVTITATAVAGPASKLAFATQPSNTTAGIDITPSVRVAIQDAYGNVVTSSTSGVFLAFGANPVSGSLSGNIGLNAVAGIATFAHLYIEQVASGYTLVASSSGLTSATSNAFNITAEPPTAIAVNAGDGQSPFVGAAVSTKPAVKVTSSTGKPVAGVGVTFAVVSGGGSITGATATTDASGIATVGSWTVGTSPGSNTITATATGLAGSPVTFTATALAGPASKLAFATQPSNTTAGVDIAPSVRVAIQDAYGNTVTTATNGVFLAFGTNPVSGSLSGDIGLNAAAGIATFAHLYIEQAGTGYTITATSPGLTSVTSDPFNIAPDVATAIVTNAGTGQSATVGATVSTAPSVKVRDHLGNGVAGVSVTFGVTVGSITGASATTNAAGIATVGSWTLGVTSGTQTLTATASGLSGSPVSITATATPDAAASLQITTQPTSSTSGAAINPSVVVKVEDAHGNVVTTASNTVAMAIGTNPAAGVLSGTVSIAAVAGVATFSSLSLDKAGSGYTLSATATGLTGATSSPFNVTAGSPARIVITTQPTNAIVGSSIAPAIAVAITDAAGNATTATNSVSLAIGTNPGSGTLSGTTTVAAVGGVASFSDISIDNAGAGYTITASSSGLTGATSNSFNIIGFTAIAVGNNSACAITSTGAGYCWGSGAQGQLGNGAFANSSVPVAVSGGRSFSSIGSHGGGNACGVSSGDAYCWGSNIGGQLGDGTTTNQSSPVLVTSGLAFSLVVPNSNHSCGLTTSGATYCWGNGGTIGDGTSSQRSAPTAVSGGLTFSSLSTQNDSYTCGLTTDGAGYCWGANGNGMFGNGTTTNSTVPTAISGGLTFIALSPGMFHGCGIVSGGTAYCWGRNNVGQLGDGTNTDNLTPVAMAGGLSFTALSAAGNFSCGLVSGGTAYCWGAGSSGLLGNGGTTNSNVPVAVSGGLTFTSISSGTTSTCAIATGGGIYCWGIGTAGQLGNGATSNSSVPVRVKGP